MPISREAARRNLLLARMRDADLDLIADAMEPVRLPKGFVIVEAGAPVEAVYFPQSGLGSILATSPGGQSVEVGMFGRDGAAPTAAVMGLDRAPMRIIIQVEGEGLRITRAALLGALENSATLRELLIRYVQALYVQMAFTALSNAVHRIEERLARWILMCHDRLDGHVISLTHEYMSTMIAVRRPGVTSALHVLEGHGFIRSTRGLVTIRNRAALEQFAADAYGQAEAEYRRLIGPASE